MNVALRIDKADTNGQASALTVAGDMDLATVSVLESTADHVISDHRTVILDLTDVTFCDSSSLNTLLRLRRRAQDAGGELILAAPPPQMMRLLTITGAGSVFTIYDSLAEAWKAHSAPGTPPTA